MGKGRNGSLPANSRSSEEEEAESSSRRKSKSRSVDRDDSDSDSLREGKKKKEGRSDKGKGRKSRRRYSSSEDKDSDSESESEYSDSEGSGSESQSGSDSDSEEERRRRRRKRRERGERERKRRKEKERKRRRKEKERDEERTKRKKKEKERKEKKKQKKERGKTGAVTNSWGKYGVIRETDMWNKRPEFTAWLAEVKKVNLESLPNWEEKQMFKDFMEDHNTATFPSKKYYNLDAYHKRKMEKDMERGVKRVVASERTVFNDEEQRRQELLREREKQKEQEIETLKLAMQSGMAQAMKEQAQLKEEMAYQYKIGNFEAAAAIQRRLDPDVAM